MYPGGDCFAYAACHYLSTLPRWYATLGLPGGIKLRLRGPVRNIEELREAYEATPACIRRLFSEGDDWLEQALLVQDASLYEVPAWVAGICSVQVPSIECTPNKSPGYWRLHANGWESYYSSKELARMCK